MTDEDKDAIAMERYGKKFEQLDANEKRSVGGLFRCAHARARAGGGAGAGAGGRERPQKKRGPDPRATATRPPPCPCLPKQQPRLGGERSGVTQDCELTGTAGQPLTPSPLRLFVTPSSLLLPRHCLHAFLLLQPLSPPHASPRRQQEAHHEGHGQQQQGKGQGATPAATATTEGEHHHMSQVRGYQPVAALHNI